MDATQEHNGIRNKPCNSSTQTQPLLAKTPSAKQIPLLSTAVCLKRPHTMVAAVAVAVVAAVVAAALVAASRLLLHFLANSLAMALRAEPFLNQLI